jgi:hypothetical protein
VSRLFALDQGFPLPIVNVLRDYQTDAELVSLSEIDSRLPDLDDWEILLALHHHARDWDGLITTDTSMLNQALELSALAQTELTLVVALGAGHDPVKASGLLFAYLSRICARTRPNEGQIWRLKAGNIEPSDPMTALGRVADHQNVDPDSLIAESRIDDEILARDPLAQPTLED